MRACSNHCDRPAYIVLTMANTKKKSNNIVAKPRATNERTAPAAAPITSIKTNSIVPKPRAAPASAPLAPVKTKQASTDAECHVNMCVSPTKSTVDGVELQLSYTAEAAAPAMAQAALPPSTPPPTEPAVPPTPAVSSSKVPTAPQPAAGFAPSSAAGMDALPVAKSSWAPTYGIAYCIGRCTDLALQVYTYPVSLLLASSKQTCLMLWSGLAEHVNS